MLAGMRISRGGRVRSAGRRRAPGAPCSRASALVAVTRLWDQPLHVPFQYAHVPGDDAQDATLDMMLVKNVAEQGWFNRNPALNAPFEQHWAEWPMGGDVVAYTIKKAIVDVTDDVPLTLNLFWLLTFPLVALVRRPRPARAAVLARDGGGRRRPVRPRAVPLPQRHRTQQPGLLRRRPGDRRGVRAHARATPVVADDGRAPNPGRAARRSAGWCSASVARRGDRHLLPRVPPHARGDVRGHRRASSAAVPGASRSRRSSAASGSRPRSSPTSRPSCSAGSTRRTCSASPTGGRP